MSTGYRIMSQRGLPEDKIVRSSFCREFSYVLNKQGADYHALFTTPALDEKIDPLGGVPRPKPTDPATRTKYLAANTSLTTDYPARVVPSRYSGKMREVAGCFAARGERSPFGFDYARTHGIVWAGSIIWLVEVSANGVFATKLKAGADCCNSYSVRHLVPTDTEIKERPGLQEYRDRLSLTWYRLARGGSVVKQLLGADQIATAYQNGAPWGNQGWAFSASGAQAQAVVVGNGTSPAPCFVGARYKLAFTIVGTEFITAGFSVLEHGLNYTLKQDNTVWEPVVPGLWNGTVGPSGTSGPSDPILLIPSQNAPVHVFYASEEAVVTRWFLTRVFLPATDTRIGHGSRIDVLPPAHEHDCVYDFDYITEQLHPNGVETNAHQAITCGFTSIGFGYTGESALSTKNVVDDSWGGQYVWDIQVNGNYYSLHPDCWFWYTPPGGSPILIKACSGTFRNTRSVRDSIQHRLSYSETKSAVASVVLFMEDREAILGVFNTQTAQVGSETTSISVAVLSHDKNETLSTSYDGMCPGIDWDLNRIGNEGPSPNAFSSGGPYSSTTANGEATLALGGNAYHIVLPTSDGKISDTNFATFLICRDVKTTAESAVFAMHGNLAATPRDAYWLQGMVVNGFPYTSGEVVAFVGKV